jgi:hypothetical protein
MTQNLILTQNLMSSFRRAGALLLLCAIQAASAAPGSESGTSSDRLPPNNTSDMSIQGATPKEGEATVPMSLLGGNVGNKTANGIRVELYVLLAENMDKLRPSDPDHAFTVALKDAKTGEFLKRGEVTMTVKGATDAVEHKVPASMSDGIFRSAFKLQHPGPYKVNVAYKVGERGGAADFAYRFELPAKGGDAAHHHH